MPLPGPARRCPGKDAPGMEPGILHLHDAAVVDNRSAIPMPDCG